MTTQEEQWRREGKCPSCGGHYWAGRGYVGHSPLCPDRPRWRRPQSRSEQDRERRELTDTRGPIPLYDSPWMDHEEDRRVFLLANGIAIRPKYEEEL